MYIPQSNEGLPLYNSENNCIHICFANNTGTEPGVAATPDPTVTLNCLRDCTTRSIRAARGSNCPGSGLGATGDETKPWRTSDVNSQYSKTSRLKEKNKAPIKGVGRMIVAGRAVGQGTGDPSSEMSK